MPVIRVEKTSNYTVMPNYHLQDKRLSLKAKGLLSYILSLPNDWDYSVKGLTSIVKEGSHTVTTILKELRETGYLEMRMINPDFEHKVIRWEYVIYEKPHQYPDFQCIDNQPIDNQCIENRPIYKVHTNKELNNKVNNKFNPPTIEEIEAYCKERKNHVDAKKFYDYYAVSDWKDSKGNKVKNWKQKVITWEKRDSNKAPDFYMKDKKRVDMDDIRKKIFNETKLS